MVLKPPLFLLRLGSSDVRGAQVWEAYGTPVGHLNFFHSRSTTHTAPPHAPPCGREAPQGRIDQRLHVVARSIEEGVRVLTTHFCKDLDFASNVALSHKDVPLLQAPFRQDDAEADYSKTATTQALVRHFLCFFEAHCLCVFFHVCTFSNLSQIIDHDVYHEIHRSCHHASRNAGSLTA